jgi:hypothetical protein
MTLMKVTMNNIRQPAEPKPEVVECAIVELLEIAQRQGITPTDFIQLLDSGMPISDFLASADSACKRQQQHRLRFLGIDDSQASCWRY